MRQPVLLIDEPETWPERIASHPLASCGPGETVFADGSTTGQLMILKSGEVAIFKDGMRIAMYPNLERFSASFPRC